MAGCAPELRQMPAVDARIAAVNRNLDRAGRSDLHYAALDGDLARIESLIAAGADVNLADRAGFTPLHFAGHGQHADAARAVLAAGAAVDARDAFGKTPLAVALVNVRDRDGEVIGVLLEAGADPDAKNYHGISARGLAASVTNYDLMRFFH
jgi:ankyrin repeat protein